MSGGHEAYHSRIGDEECLPRCAYVVGVCGY